MSAARSPICSGVTSVPYAIGLLYSMHESGVAAITAE